MNLILKLAAAALVALLPSIALAQTNPGLTQGQKLTPAQWNSLFAGKQDTLGFTPMNAAGGVFTGRVTTAAPGASLAGFNLTPGTAPATPANGDLWATSSSLFARINGVTVDLIASPCTVCAVTNATNTFTANQIVSLNATTPAAQTGMMLQLVQNNGSSGRVEVDTFAGTALYSGIRANGTAASPTTLVLNDEIASLNAGGYDGSTRSTPAAAIRVFSGGTWSPSSHPTAVEFATTAVGSTTLTSRMRIESDGGITMNGATSLGLGTISTISNLNASTPIQIANNSTGTGAISLLQAFNGASNASFGIGGINFSSIAALANKAFVFSNTGSAGISIYATGTNPIDNYVNGSRVGGFTSAGAFTLTSALGIASGGTNCGAASGTCLDNITGFSSTGFIQRTGAGTYTFSAGAPASTIALGTPITGGTSGRILFDSSNTLGEYSISGSGTTVAMATGPTISSLTVTGAFTATGLVTNADLVNSSLTIGSTSVALGATAATVSGLTLASPTITGTLSASTANFSNPVAIATSSATAFLVEAASNPAFQVDTSAVSQATGLKINALGVGSGVGLVATSTGTDESIVINAKGAGAVFLANVSTGSVIVRSALTYGGILFANTTTGSAGSSLVGSASPTFTGPVAMATLGLSGAVLGTDVFSVVGSTSFSGSNQFKSGSATAIAVGPTGSTNPVFQVDNSAGGSPGIKISSGGGTPALAVIDSATNTGLTINAKGTGTIAFGNVSTGAVTVSPALTASTSITSPFHAASGLLTFQSNGSTFAGSIDTGQRWIIGLSGATVPTTTQLLVTRNAATPVALGFNSTMILNDADGTVSRFTSSSIGTNNGYNALRANGTTGSPTALVSGNQIATFFGFPYATSASPGYVLGAGAGFNTTITETTCTTTACGHRFDITGVPTGSATGAVAAAFGAGVMIGNPATNTDQGNGTINATQYFAGNTAGLASKTCTINTANAATGITITIKGGVITGTTTC